jgi:hypothetical protein
VNASQFRRPKVVKFLDAVFYPSALMREITASPNSFARHEIIDHHYRSATFVLDQVAGPKKHGCTTQFH